MYLTAITYINDCHKVCKRLQEFQIDGSGNIYNTQYQINCIHENTYIQ